MAELGIFSSGLRVPWAPRPASRSRERLSRSDFSPDRLSHGGRLRDRGSKGRLLISDMLLLADVVGPLSAQSRAGRAAEPDEARCRPGPDRLRLGLVAHPCPRHGLAASLTAFERSTKPASGRQTPEPPTRGPGAPPARGACARESRAIPCMQLPRMRPRSDRGMSQGGRGSRLSPYCGSSWAVLWIAFHRGSRSR